MARKSSKTGERKASRPDERSGKGRIKRAAGKGPAAGRRAGKRRGPLRWLFSWIRRALLLGIGLGLAWISAYVVFDPPTTPYIAAETARLGEVDRQWVPLEEMSPALPRAIVAAEDANFCAHWGFDMAAIRAALSDGATRGASTISQQVVKNVFLWQGRSWPRKALEAGITPVMEAIWPKRRILEVYLNVAEFDEGVFGAEAAARHYFDKGPEALSLSEAALLATVLPNPKRRSAARPSEAQKRRARRIADGARTIAVDGRAACFED